MNLYVYSIMHIYYNISSAVQMVCFSCFLLSPDLLSGMCCIAIGVAMRAQCENEFVRSLDCCSIESKAKCCCIGCNAAVYVEILSAYETTVHCTGNIQKRVQRSIKLLTDAAKANICPGAGGFVCLNSL